MKSFQKCGEVGGGTWSPLSFSGQLTQASGVSGDIIVLSSAGRRVKLTSFHTNTTNVQSGISIDVDGVDVVSLMDLGDVTPTNIAANTFWISPPGAFAANGTDPRANDIQMSQITGDVITIKKDPGNTTEILGYSFETGA